MEPNNSTKLDDRTKTKGDLNIEDAWWWDANVDGRGRGRVNKLDRGCVRMLTKDDKTIESGPLLVLAPYSLYILFA